MNLRAITYGGFTERVLGVRLTTAQRVCDAVCFDGVQPGTLQGDERQLARTMFGSVETVPDVARTVIVRKKGRASGDTWRGSMRALHLAVTHPLSGLAPGESAYVVFVAPELRLARIPLEYARGFVDTVPSLRALLVSQTEDRLVLRRSDGRLVRFEALPASAGGVSLRGRSLLLVVLDEAAFFKSGDSYEVNDVELYRAVAPRVLPGGQVLIPSTPWVESGLLHQLFSKNFGKPKTAIAAHCPTLLMRDDATTVQMVERERELDPDNARREFDAEWGSGEASLLRSTDVDAAIMTGVESLPRVAGGYYASAIDLASGRVGGDFIVQEIGHVEYEARDGSPPTQILVVDVARDWSSKSRGLKRLAGLDKVDLDAVERDMADAAKHWRCSLHADSWGFDLFQTRMKQRGVRLVECSMAPSAQAKRARLLASYFTQRRIRIPDNDELVRQLKQIVVTKTAGGTVRFASPNRKGSHDDYPKALMLLVEAAAKLQPSTMGGLEIQDAQYHWRPLGGGLVVEPRQFFQTINGVRLSVAAPLGTPEHEQQQRDRLGRGVMLPSDLEELGEERCRELMGFGPSAPTINATVRR